MNVRVWKELAMNMTSQTLVVSNKNERDATGWITQALRKPNVPSLHAFFRRDCFFFSSFLYLTQFHIRT
jgi:hypothetical protein